MENKIYIYALLDEFNNVRYVGKSNNPKQRYYSHISQSKNRKTHKECWIYGMINHGFKPKLIIIEECTIDNWIEREKHYIKVHDNLTNLTEGGDGTYGNRHTEETKKLMSINRTGNKNAFYNKTHSEETKKYLSELNKEYYKHNINPFKDKNHSKETKTILSKKGFQRWKSGNLNLPPIMFGEYNPSSKKRIFISPNGERHTVFSTQKFCIEHMLSYDTVKQNINKGVIKLPEDIVTLSRQRKKSLNTIGWEIIE